MAELNARMSVGVTLGDDPDKPPICMTFIREEFHDDMLTTNKDDVYLTIEDAKAFAMGVIAAVQKSENRSKKYEKGEVS